MKQQEKNGDDDGQIHTHIANDMKREERDDGNEVDTRYLLTKMKRAKTLRYHVSDAPKRPTKARCNESSIEIVWV